MIDALLTAAAVVFGLAYLWLKTGDAMRAAWRGVKRWLPALPAVTSRRSAPRQSFPVAGNSRSYAVELRREPLGTQAGNTVPTPVPTLREQLTELSDDELLTLLALIPGDVDGYRYADSRIAKFIGGRIEERLVQVRAVRGKEQAEKQTAPQRMLIVRDLHGAREIPR
jgi:hypothetical protein